MTGSKSTIQDAIAGIEAHERGWCAAQEISIDDPELAPAVALEYRKVELHTQVEDSCWSVGDGWQITLRDSMGDALIRHEEPYGHLYPDSGMIRMACVDLVERWRRIRRGDRACLYAAGAWYASVSGTDRASRIADGVDQVEAGALRLRDVARALGVDSWVIQRALDDREAQRWADQQYREMEDDWERYFRGA